MKKRDYVYLATIILLMIILVGVICYFSLNNNEEVRNNEVLEESIAYNDEVKSFYVDLKGAVKKPGGYKVNEGMIINDLINIAGGLKSNASTKNINLSEKLKDSMVVYIFTKGELTTTTKVETTCTTNVIEVNNCINNDSVSESVNSNENNKALVNINTASKEELMTVTGIGESKADSIIIYRNKTLFKKIEDIMNVTGIGNSLYDKIKDYITV